MTRSKKSLSVLRVEEALLKEGYKDIVKELGADLQKIYQGDHWLKLLNRDKIGRAHV